MFLLITLNIFRCSGASVVNFEKVNMGCDVTFMHRDRRQTNKEIMIPILDGCR